MSAPASPTAGERYPQRIVCLTEETTETLYLLGEQDRIVGISGFTVRPPQARREKPKVSAFTSAKIDKILALEPDLVLGFSDLQADIAADLIRAGIAVHVFNHRSVEQILDMITVLGGLVGCHARAQGLVRDLETGLEEIAMQARELPRRPRVYFEEWDEPPIAAIRWVSDLIQLAGADNVFIDLAEKPLGKDRIIAAHQEIIDAAPDIIIGSWCGKKFRPERVAERPGYAQIPAVRRGHLYEVKSAIILQPGPAALTDGVRALADIIRHWAEDPGATTNG
ncbi:MAG: cobalamin-binding protein [Pseudomonadota bacterium]